MTPQQSDVVTLAQRFSHAYHQHAQLSAYADNKEEPRTVIEAVERRAAERNASGYLLEVTAELLRAVDVLHESEEKGDAP